MRTTGITSISRRSAHLLKIKSLVRKTVTLSPICLLSLLLGPRAYANSGSAVCDNSTLNGEYASTVGGEIYHSDGTVETRQGIVMMHFDGSGKFTQTDYVLDTINGVTTPTPGPIDPNTGFQNHEAGAYKVDRDCTGHLEIHFAPPPVNGATGAVLQLYFVLGNHGADLRTVVTSVTPPSTVLNDITGFTLHSEGSQVGDIP
jgi:hypothetical protein